MRPLHCNVGLTLVKHAVDHASTINACWCNTVQQGATVRHGLGCSWLWYRPQAAVSSEQASDVTSVLRRRQSSTAVARRTQSSKACLQTDSFGCCTACSAKQSPFCCRCSSVICSSQEGRQLTIHHGRGNTSSSALYNQAAI